MSSMHKHSTHYNAHGNEVLEECYFKLANDKTWLLKDKTTYTYNNDNELVIEEAFKANKESGTLEPHQQECFSDNAQGACYEHVQSVWNKEQNNLVPNCKWTTLYSVHAEAYREEFYEWDTQLSLWEQTYQTNFS